MKKLVIEHKNGRQFIVLIDDDIYHRVVWHKWHVTGNGYACCTTYNGKRTFLHCLVMGAYPTGKTEIDHINRNKLDNRRKNLRFCTRLENRQNLPKQKRNNTGYRGVFAYGKKFRARVCYMKKCYHVGMYKTAKEAHRAIKELEAKIRNV